MSTTTVIQGKTVPAEFADLFQVLPATIQVAVNGGLVEARITPSAKGRPRYEASVRLPLLSEDSHAEILSRVQVAFAGEAIAIAGKGVYLSDPKFYPQVYAKGKNEGKAHPKAGERIPNSGDHWTVLFSNAVQIAGIAFQLSVRATVTSREVDGETVTTVRLNVNAMQRVTGQGGRAEIGSAEGVTF